MKVLVSIATYGTKNVQYLNRVIDEYKSYKNYTVDITVHGTVNLDRTDVNFVYHENPKNTVYFHRQEFIDKQDDYDLYIFTEDDMLIKESNVDVYMKYDRQLPLNHCLGFLRFENTPENIKYFIDLWLNVPNYSFIKNYRTEINELDYFSTTNVHQACYILTKEKLKYVISNMKYAVDSDSLESASSGIFADWVLKAGAIHKVLPINKNELSNCYIEHLPGNHCNYPGINLENPPEVFKNNVVNESFLYNSLNIN